MPRCKYCAELYKPTRPMQPGRVCNNIECQHKHSIEFLSLQGKKRAKAERIAQREDRKVIRLKLESMKTIPQLIKEADQVFMACIRERDRLLGYACISSGLPLDWSGNNVDAGHYRSRGAATHLRYNEDNCHAQSKHDNRYLAGNIVNYRANLIERIGIERVEALESNNEPKKWTREELKAIKATYKAKLKEFKK